MFSFIGGLVVGFVVCVYMFIDSIKRNGYLGWDKENETIIFGETQLLKSFICEVCGFLYSSLPSLPCKCGAFLYAPATKEKVAAARRHFTSSNEWEN